MRRTRTFKAGEHLESISSFVKTTADEITGDHGFPLLCGNVKITVETTQAKELALDPVLEELELAAAKEAVEEFLTYRRDELRKPIRSVPGLKRILKPFKANPALLAESINTTMRQGWTGLFGSDSSRSRKDHSKGRSGEF